MYQIGDATNPREDDERFDTEGEAVKAAHRAALDDSVYAVWRWDDEDYADTIYLVYQGDLWRKA